VLDNAVNSCKTYVAASMDYINANASPNTRLKVISNLYYPGYNADNVQSTCRDATTGQTVNLRDRFLPAITRMNYWMCEYARQKGFQCADSFAQYMGADFDSNGDGQVDSDALRYVPGDTEAAYVQRITVAQRRLHPVGRRASDLQRPDRQRRPLGRQHRHRRTALPDHHQRPQSDLEHLRP
jgi:hypothetical protein